VSVPVSLGILDIGYPGSRIPGSRIPRFLAYLLFPSFSFSERSLPHID